MEEIFNVILKTVKHLEGNVKGKLHDLGVGNDIFGSESKNHRQQKQK
jgi:hypothetical protein